MNSKKPFNFKEMKNVKNHSQLDDTNTFALLIKVASSEFELSNCLFKLQANVVRFGLCYGSEIKFLQTQKLKMTQQLSVKLKKK